jgi:hypothetical protein
MIIGLTCRLQVARRLGNTIRLLLKSESHIAVVGIVNLCDKLHVHSWAFVGILRYLLSNKRITLQCGKFVNGCVGGRGLE